MTTSWSLKSLSAARVFFFDDFLFYIYIYYSCSASSAHLGSDLQNNKTNKQFYQWELNADSSCKSANYSQIVRLRPRDDHLDPPPHIKIVQNLVLFRATFFP